VKNLFRNIFILLLGAFLVSSGWAPFNFILGPMIGLIPLLYLEEKWANNKVSKGVVWLYAYLFFASWNFLTIWWVQNASWVGVIASVLVNSIFYASIFTLFSFVKKHLKSRMGFLSLLVFWIAWEYVELIDWDLSWPWMTLGFSLANHQWAIQWYEYTGSLGGSLWLLVSNILIWSVVKVYRTDKYAFKNRVRGGAIVVFLPVIVSILIYINYEEPTEKAEFVLVQPNIDPYSEKFNDGMTTFQQLSIMMKLADEVTTKKTKFILFPETAIPTVIWDKEIDFYAELQLLKTWNSKDKAGLITGTNFGEIIEINDKNNIPSDVKLNAYTNQYYRRYNSALFIDKNEIQEVYHKSRLVIGVERIPSYFVFLQRYLKNLDDDTNAAEFNPNNGIQKERTVFKDQSGTVAIAPIICYESIFGEYVNDYVLKGANVLGVITNDAWWGDTPGYKQHFSYSILRAIETRRSVVRSANTGWSGFINTRGDVISKSKYWEPTAMVNEVPLNSEITFYVKHGDFLGRLAIPLSLLLLANAYIRMTKDKTALGRIS
jgi:apolipoprotein N-acyltransferase